jgi:hypothetical protein
MTWLDLSIKLRHGEPVGTDLESLSMHRARMLIAVITLAGCLTGCATVRGIFGAVSPAQEETSAPGTQPLTPSSEKPRSIQTSEDMERARKTLPGGLGADQANSQHSIAIPPQ